MRDKNWWVVEKYDWLQIFPGQGYQALHVQKVGDDKYHLFAIPVEFFALVEIEEWLYEKQPDGTIDKTMRDRYKGVIALDTSGGYFQEANENGICKIGTSKEDWKNCLNNRGAMTDKSEIVFGF
jgi:hypothetical protein